MGCCIGGRFGGEKKGGGGEGGEKNFFGGGGGGGGCSKNSVEEGGHRERGSGNGSPIVRGSGGSCNLVHEISFHIVKFSSFLVL